MDESSATFPVFPRTSSLTEDMEVRCTVGGGNNCLKISPGSHAKHFGRRRYHTVWKVGVVVTVSALASSLCPSHAFVGTGFYSTRQHAIVPHPPRRASRRHGLSLVRQEDANCGTTTSSTTLLSMVARRESEISDAKQYINQETLQYFLNDDGSEDHHGTEDDSVEAANQVADKDRFSKMSDEAKFKATLALKRSTTTVTTTKVRASVKETGNDTMSHYLKSMGGHELLRKEDEEVLGRQVRILVRWDEKRMELEEKLLRTPTFAEWAAYVGISVPDLKKQIRRSQRAKAALIEANLRLVVTLARQAMKGNTARSEISFVDACQEGIIGLTKACEKFDPDKGFRFSTYANWWIKREVRESVANQGNTVKVPYNVVMKINKMKIAEVTLKDQLGRIPTDNELADRLELSIEQLNFYRQKSQTAFSIDKQINNKGGKGSSAASGGEGSFTVGDRIRDPGQTPQEAASTQMLKDDVRRLLTTLSPREQAVIRLRFGLDGDDSTPKTLDYIAKRFDVPVDKIRKVEARALLKLKQPYRSNSVKCYISDL